MQQLLSLFNFDSNSFLCILLIQTNKRPVQNITYTRDLTGDYSHGHLDY